MEELSMIWLSMAIGLIQDRPSIVHGQHSNLKESHSNSSEMFNLMVVGYVLKLLETRCLQPSLLIPTSLSNITALQRIQRKCSELWYKLLTLSICFLIYGHEQSLAARTLNPSKHKDTSQTQNGENNI